MSTKAALATFILMASSLLGCGYYLPENARDGWCYEEAPSCHPCLASARAFLKPKFPCGALQLELIRDQCGYNLYLSTICYVLTNEPCAQIVEVELSDSCESKTFCADVFEGAQRCRLPDDAKDFLIDALLSGECVQVRVCIHTAEVTPCGFCEAYNRL